MNRRRATGNCASCDSAGASVMCVDCDDVPKYQADETRTVTYYCNFECQKDHWPWHKHTCKTLQERRKLRRAALLLLEALVAYREAFYDIDLTSIEARDDVLVVKHNPRSRENRAKRGPFPDCLVADSLHRDAALVVNRDVMATALLSTMARRLLEGGHISLAFSLSCVVSLTPSRHCIYDRNLRRPAGRGAMPGQARPSQRVCPAARAHHLPAHHDQGDDRY